jgi:uncharacterized protein
MQEFILSEKDKKVLLKTARESLTSKLEGRTAVYPEPTKKIETVCGAFVTLHKKGPERQLRGCIGQIIGIHPLVDTIKEMAVSSGLKDPRFSPVRLPELPELEFEISALSPLHRIENPEQVVVGTHGIYIKSGYSSGVLLPQVAEEQRWDRETFLSHTCLKAGLPTNCWKTGVAELYIFSAIVFDESLLTG